MIVALVGLALLVAGVIGVLLRWRFRRCTRYRCRTRSPVARVDVPSSTEGDSCSPNRRKPDWVRAEVLRLKAVLGTVGVRSVANTFNRLHGARATVGRTFVAGLIKTHRYEIACLTRELRRRPPKHYRVNAVWAMDFTFQSDVEGKAHVVLGLIDHGSRVLLRLRRLTNRGAWTVLGHLCLAIGEFGKPRAVRSDNEPVFRSRVLRVAMRLLRIRQQFTLAHSPWQNGRIERLFGTLKPLLRKLVLANAIALDKALFEFQLFYNHVRSHQNLGGRTPAEVWRARSARVPLGPVREQPTLVSALGGLLVGYFVRR